MNYEGKLIGAVGTLTWICVCVKKVWRMNLYLKKVRGRAMVVIGPWIAVLGGKAADGCWASC